MLSLKEAPSSTLRLRMTRTLPGCGTARGKERGKKRGDKRRGRGKKRSGGTRGEGGTMGLWINIDRTKLII